MHIPKTAGMTLQQLVRERYSLDDQLFLVYERETNHGGFEDKDTLKLIMGHFRYGYHKYSERPHEYYTFLRNPAEHILSLFNYTRDYPDKYKNLTQEEYDNLIQFTRGRYGNNLQTRFISGMNIIEGRENETLEKAKENLRNFKFIGLTEDFDTSLYIMGKKLGWKAFYYQNSNEGVARKKSAIPAADVMKEVLEINCYDVELYKYAVELYNSQKQQIPGLSKKVKRFKFENKWFWKLNPAYTQLKVALGLGNIKMLKK